MAGPPYADVAPLAKRFLECAPERCIWGSDWPHTNIEGYMPDDGDLLDQLLDWAPDAALRQKVLVEIRPRSTSSALDPWERMEDERGREGRGRSCGGGWPPMSASG